MGNGKVTLEPFGGSGKNATGTAYRVIGILIWLLSGVGGVLLLAYSANSVSRVRAYTGYNTLFAYVTSGGIIGAVTIWLTGFFVGLSFFAIGEVIRLLAVKATTKYMVEGDLSGMLPQMQQMPAQMMQAPPQMQNVMPQQPPMQMEPQREPVHFSWRPAAGTTMICPVCGCQQEALRPTCQQCGVQFTYPEN